MPTVPEVQKKTWALWVTAGYLGPKPPNWGAFCNAQESARLDKLAAIERFKAAGIVFSHNSDGSLKRGELERAGEAYPHLAVPVRMVKGTTYLSRRREAGTAAAGGRVWNAIPRRIDHSDKQGALLDVAQQLHVAGGAAI